MSDQVIRTPTPTPDFEIFTTEELRWDLSCHVGSDLDRAIRQELQRRSESEFGQMRRRGGPFVKGWKFTGIREARA